MIHGHAGPSQRVFSERGHVLEKVLYLLIFVKGVKGLGRRRLGALIRTKMWLKSLAQQSIL